MVKKKLPTWATTVTPFSKMLALSMLIVIPILAFFYGMYYQRQLDWGKGPIEYILIPPNNTTPTKTATPQDGTMQCQTNADCPSDYTCNQAGPIPANGHIHKTCWKNGHAMPL
jgi:hypothetical protein